MPEHERLGWVDLFDKHPKIWKDFNILMREIFTRKDDSFVGWTPYKVDCVNLAIDYAFLRTIGIDDIDELDSYMNPIRSRVNGYKSKTCAFLGMEAHTIINQVLNKDFCVQFGGISQEIIGYFEVAEREDKIEVVDSFLPDADVKAPKFDDLSPD